MVSVIYLFHQLEQATPLSSSRSLPSNTVSSIYYTCKSGFLTKGHRSLSRRASLSSDYLHTLLYDAGNISVRNKLSGEVTVSLVISSSTSLKQPASLI